MHIGWKDVVLGAAVTSLLFNFGKFLIGLYLGQSSVVNTFGAAGSLALLLIWIYYSAQILFLGAEFTQVYAKKYSREAPAQFRHGSDPRAFGEGKPAGGRSRLRPVIFI